MEEDTSEEVRFFENVLTQPTTPMHTRVFRKDNRKHNPSLNCEVRRSRCLPQRGTSCGEGQPGTKGRRTEKCQPARQVQACRKVWNGIREGSCTYWTIRVRRALRFALDDFLGQLSSLCEDGFDQYSTLVEASSHHEDYYPSRCCLVVAAAG
jgi:hypothetical protein